MKNKTFELNSGTGMVLGVVFGTAVALIVSLITGDGSIWSWAIPVGLATGLAIGAGKSNRAIKKESS